MIQKHNFKKMSIKKSNSFKQNTDCFKNLFFYLQKEKQKKKLFKRFVINIITPSQISFYLLFI